MTREKYRRFLGLCVCITAFASRASVAEELPEYGRAMVERIVTLGQPQLEDPFLPPVQQPPVQQVGAQWPNDTAVQTEQYITRRIDELPPPGDPGLPLPTYERVDRLREKKTNPLTIDNVFMGRAGVDAPSTNVKMNQLGMLYEHRHPVTDRFFLTFRPAADILFLSGPGGTAPDLPEQLYKVALDIQGDYQFNERLGISLGITPGLWTDFRQVSGDDWRLPARLLATYWVWDGLFIAGGIVWTDNYNSNLLPGVGLIWEVTERTKLELLWPRSKLSHRLRENLDIYTVFERGGSTYNIRVNDLDEDMQYRDLRLMIGAKSDMWSRASIFAEAGIAFDRKFRLENQGNFDIKRAFIFRVGTRF